MIREIVTHDIDKKNNPEILQEVLREVTDFAAKETKDCIRDLNDTLDNLIKTEGNKRGAIGLSANQIDYDLAISAVTLKDKRYILINPKLQEENGRERLFRIGCFSLYKYRAMVRYNDDVVISYYDENGKKKKLKLKGDQSCVVQHEMDHLVGDLLYERLEHKEKDLFVPRESLYKDGKIPLRNHGLLFELRRRLGLQKVMSGPVFYSSLFNDYTDYVKFVSKEAESYKELLDAIIRYTPEKGRTVELGNGTSALSVHLNSLGYDTSCAEIDKDMLDLAIRINEANKTKVNYDSTNLSALPYHDKDFDTFFSIEVLETLNDEKLVLELIEAKRIAETVIFMVPTIKIVSNGLRGNERLRSTDSWKEFISKHGFDIAKVEEIDNGQKAIFVLS